MSSLPRPGVGPSRGLLTFVWVASTVGLVAHGSFTAASTAVGTLALLLGGVQGLEVSVIDRWQKVWRAARESDLAGWLDARQLFVIAAAPLADQSVL